MSNTQNKTKIQTLAICAVMAAVMCILGPNSVPIGPVPVTLTNLVLYFTVYILGTKGTLISYAVYLLLGAFGLPVFSGYAGGLAKLAGPTGGYLIGFFFMILAGGICLEKSKANVVITCLGFVVGTAIAYLFGTVWFVQQMDYTWGAALGVCVFPFVPFDLIKIVLGGILGKAIRTALLKSGLLTT